MREDQYSLLLSILIVILDVLCESIPLDNPRRDVTLKYARDVKRCIKETIE